MLPDARSRKDSEYSVFLVDKLLSIHLSALEWVSIRLGCDAQHLLDIKSKSIKATYLEQYALECLLSGIRGFRRNFMKRQSGSEIWANLMIETRESFHPVLKASLQGSETSDKASDILGYSPLALRQHLERGFTQEMSFSNYGEWEVDHIRPVFDFPLWEVGIDAEVHSLKNLRPLWRFNNQSKGAKLTG